MAKSFLLEQTERKIATAAYNTLNKRAVLTENQQAARQIQQAALQQNQQLTGQQQMQQQTQQQTQLKQQSQLKRQKDLFKQELQQRQQEIQGCNQSDEILGQIKQTQQLIQDTIESDDANKLTQVQFVQLLQSDERLQKLKQQIVSQSVDDDKAIQTYTQEKEDLLQNIQDMVSYDDDDDDDGVLLQQTLRRSQALQCEIDNAVKNQGTYAKQQQLSVYQNQLNRIKEQLESDIVTQSCQSNIMAQLCDIEKQINDI